MTRSVLIFSGHNDRAVIALCRALSARSLPFRIVASSDKDSIFKSFWAPQVLWTRGDSSVDLSLFERARTLIPKEERLIYCPTTEFINSFVLENRENLELMGIELTQPSAEVYAQLSNKSQSTRLVEEICGLKAPLRLDWDSIEPPCVFKPNRNVFNGSVHYPVLCFSQREVTSAQARLDPQQWFVQKYIFGQSHYLCGYISRKGEFRCYWQTNLMQQADGKSIVLARTTSNPGLNVYQFFTGLARMGYYGPVMMEVIEEPDGQLNFIEINPRFWGPLQLGVDACPEMFDMYARDADFNLPAAASTQSSNSGTLWYAWSEGARMRPCRLYPAADEFSDADLQRLLRIHDVFLRDDTPDLTKSSLDTSVDV